jgi:hypothetical protein
MIGCTMLSILTMCRRWNGVSTAGECML